MTIRRLLCISLVPVALLAAAGCGGSSGSGGPSQTLKPGETIGMKQLRFHPDHVRVKVGQAVVFEDQESIPHDVVADSGADFRSPTFGKGKTYTWTPSKAGTVKYECTLHPGMEGTIDVVS